MRTEQESRDAQTRHDEELQRLRDEHARECRIMLGLLADVAMVAREHDRSVDWADNDMAVYNARGHEARQGQDFRRVRDALRQAARPIEAYMKRAGLSVEECSAIARREREQSARRERAAQLRAEADRLDADPSDG